MSPKGIFICVFIILLLFWHSFIKVHRFWSLILYIKTQETLSDWTLLRQAHHPLRTKDVGRNTTEKPSHQEWLQCLNLHTLGTLLLHVSLKTKSPENYSYSLKNYSKCQQLADSNQLIYNGINLQVNFLLLLPALSLSLFSAGTFQNLNSSHQAYVAALRDGFTIRLRQQVWTILQKWARFPSLSRVLMVMLMICALFHILPLCLSFITLQLHSFFLQLRLTELKWSVIGCQSCSLSDKHHSYTSCLNQPWLAGKVTRLVYYIKMTIINTWKPVDSFRTTVSFIEKLQLIVGLCKIISRAWSGPADCRFDTPGSDLSG